MRIDDTVSLLHAFTEDFDMLNDRLYEEAKLLAEFIGSNEEKRQTIRLEQGLVRSIAPMPISEYLKREVYI